MIKVLSVGLAMVAGTASAVDWQLGPFTRPVDKPVIAPDSASTFVCPMRKKVVGWEAADTFNPAAVVYNGRICVLYRAEDDATKGLGRRTSRIGLATSEDGIHFSRRPAPVFYPDEDVMKGYEWSGGCEDPRVVEGPDGVFFMYYSLWNRENPLGMKATARLGVATSTNLVDWKKHGPVFPDDPQVLDTWHKSAAVVTSLQEGRLKAVKLNGKYWMYWGEHAVQLASSDDLIRWTPVRDESGNVKKLIRPRPERFDAVLTECGPPAILTERGIVLIYNGKGRTASQKGTYAPGQVLFDKNDPSKVMARSDVPFMSPELDFEKSGQYRDGTVFTEGLVYFKGRWFLYYGAADSFVGVAICENDFLLGR